MKPSTTSPIKDIFVFLIVVALAIWLSPFLVVLLPIIIFYRLRKKKQQRDVIKQIQQEWFPRGKHVFFVYSGRDIWKTYFETEFIPRFKDKAVIWNWSTRIKDGWNDELPEAKLLRLFKGYGSFYPSAFLVTPEGAVKVFAFHDAYIDFVKSGKMKYKEMETEFLKRLEEMKA